MFVFLLTSFPSLSLFYFYPALCGIDASPPRGSAAVVHSDALGVQFITLSRPLSVFGEPICPIVGSKEALCRANEIKAHLGEGINQTDRFNGLEQREGGWWSGEGRVDRNGQITAIGYYQH